jgi:hypothetical protein
MMLAPLTVVSRFIKRVRIATLMWREENARAADKPDKAWRLIEQTERILGQRWPMKNFPGWANLQVACAAMQTGRYQLAYDCALTAEEVLRKAPRSPGLKPADLTYLIAYAIMVSRWSRYRLGERLPGRALADSPLSKFDVLAVEWRWRRSFPVVYLTNVP